MGIKYVSKDKYAPTEGDINDIKRTFFYFLPITIGITSFFLTNGFRNIYWMGNISDLIWVILIPFLSAGILSVAVHKSFKKSVLYAAIIAFIFAIYVLLIGGFGERSFSGESLNIFMLVFIMPLIVITIIVIMLGLATRRWYRIENNSIKRSLQVLCYLIFIFLLYLLRNY